MKRSYYSITISLLFLIGTLSLSAAPMTQIMSLEYFYAKDGTITGRSVNGRMLHYQYDKLGQLLAVVDDKGQAVEKYVYDRAGNILEKTVNGVTTVNTYDKANQLVTSATDGRVTHYRYDAAGRLVEEGDKSYRYGYLDKVLEVSENNSSTATFDYHLNGQIAAATRNGATETFTWDGLALIHRGSESYLNEPYITGGNPLLSSKGNVLFNDMLGTTLGVKSTEFTATPRTAFGEYDTLSLSSEAERNAYREGGFTGKPKVDELGYAFLFRNYRAEQGKWQTQDPIGYPDGWNNLAYIKNRVQQSIDWLGAVTVTVTEIISLTGYWEGIPVIGDAQYIPELGIYQATITFSWGVTVVTDRTGPVTFCSLSSCPGHSVMEKSTDPLTETMTGLVQYTDDSAFSDASEAWYNSMSEKVTEEINKLPKTRTYKVDFADCRE